MSTNLTVQVPLFSLPATGACILKSQARFVGDVAGFRLGNGSISLVGMSENGVYPQL